VNIFLADAAATAALAQRLCRCLPDDTAGWTVLLEGELGAGKSTFARALLRGFGHEGVVPSPTYTLVEPYRLPGRLVYHIDLYRIAAEEELRYLGFNELERGLRLIEWPDRAPGLAAAADVKITLCYQDAGRAASIAGLSDRGRRLVGALGGEPETESTDELSPLSS
jgi:tRNA threonylcarbamoyladenosine biosynthesis protein TsaE